MNRQQLQHVTIAMMAGLLIGAAPEKLRLMIVDSYHPEYTSSQYVYRGLCRGLFQLGYLDDEGQLEACKTQDMLESSKVVLKRLWMDTKRKSSKKEITDTAVQVTEQVKEFKPDLLFLGDDNAADYIGNQFLDTEIPIIFWGLKSTPIKYGLVESMERPGHNVTGVYQVGYDVESLELLKRITPEAKTLAVLADMTEVGRGYAKRVQAAAQEGRLPFHLVETVTTEEFEVFKQKALELQDKVDAFYAAGWAGFKDALGQSVSREDVARWYLTNIRKPEAAGSRQYLDLGLLCGADDSREKQGAEAATIAADLLAGKKSPAGYPPRSPSRGALMANRRRAQMLGMTLTSDMGIEEYINGSVLSTQPEESKQTGARP